MRRFLTSSLIILALVAGAVSFVPVAHAQTTPPAQTSVTGQTDPNNAPINPTIQDQGGVMSWVMTTIAKLFAWLVGIAAITLDNAVYYTVVTMGNYVHNLTAVGVAWRILRDIGNIMLIFGFLSVGISVILDMNLYGWGQKMLPMLLVAAVFLNFSLFFSEAVIDVGNLFATEFYTQINGGQLAGAKNFDKKDTSSEGISTKLMDQLGLQLIYSETMSNSGAFDAGNITVIGFMSVILFIIVAFVMFSLAFILIARFVALIFIMILSPIGFAGLAVPKLNGLANKWWGELFSQTITAPILLLMLYVALAVITDANFLKFGFQQGAHLEWTGFIPNVNAAGATNITGFAGLFLSFLVAMGLLLAVVVYAKKLGAAGADWATKTAGALSFGAVAWGANRVAGRTAYRLQRVAWQSKTFNKIDAATGRVMSRTLDRGASGTFDLRNTKLLTVPGLGKVDAGDAAKGGFVGARERSIKDHEEAVKKIETAHKEAKPTKEVREAADAHWKAEKGKNKAQKEKDEAQEKLNALKKANANQEDIREAEENLTKATANLVTATGLEKKAADERAAIDKKADAQRKFSIRENKMAYAEGIASLYGSPIGLFAYGPNTSVAAQKIKDSLKEKNKDEKLVEAIKLAVKKEGGEGDKGKDENKSDEKKGEEGGTGKEG